MTARQAAEIAEGCRAYLAAHQTRDESDPLLTIAERIAAAKLCQTLRAIMGNCTAPNQASAA